MAQITTLVDRQTNETLFPETNAEAVYFNDGKNLRQKHDELSRAIGGKADGFTLSDDFEMNDERVLQITERAKRQLLDDMWLKAGGSVIVPGKTYGLNGLDDITYEEAIDILRYTSMYSQTTISVPINLTGSFRTNFPIKANTLGCSLSTAGASAVEVLAISSVHTSGIINLSSWALSQMPYLREVRGEIIVKISNNNFTGLPMLEEIRIKKLSTSIQFTSSPKLSFDSFQYLIDNAANTSAITITVHADVYAKLTGDTTNAAAAALSEEELEQWMALIPLAADKNLIFATK